MNRRFSRIMAGLLSVVMIFIGLPNIVRAENTAQLIKDKSKNGFDIDMSEIDTAEIAEIDGSNVLKGYFDLPNTDYSVFKLLEDNNVFLASEGLTTADQGANGFMDDIGNGHECLWNGYVWPFATSQTLTALLQAIKDDSVCREEYTSMLWKLLNQYANQHYRITEDGKKIMWIDEVGTPYEHSWSSRKILEEAGWDINRGGYERGKDYNHSTFCDIVLLALTGFELKGGEAVFKPVIPDDMNYYSIDNLHIQGSEYRIVYDKTGEKYGVSAGLHIYKNGTEIQV